MAKIRRTRFAGPHHFSSPVLGGLNFGEPASMPPDEQYAIRRMVQYSFRLLRRYPNILTEEFSRLLYLLLGSELLHQFLKDLEERTRKQLPLCSSEFLSEPLEDGDDLARFVKRYQQNFNNGRNNIIKTLRNLLEKREKDLDPGSRSASLEGRFQSFAQTFGLAQKDILLIELLFIADTYQEFERFSDSISLLSFRGRHYLACALDITQGELQELLKGKLIRRHIVEFDSFVGLGLRLDQEVFLPFLRESSDTELVKTPWFKRVNTDQTIPLDYHVSLNPQVVRHILGLMRAPWKGPRHLLLYGEPGVGKTSFAQGVCRELGELCWEIRSGECVSPRERLAALWAVLEMKRDEGIILVDDADVILGSPSFWMTLGVKDVAEKKEVQELLEEPARVIWICNSTKHIERSILRRFCFALHFSSFNRRQRIMFLDNLMQKHNIFDLLEPQDKEQLALAYPNTPAGVYESAVQHAIVAGAPDREGFLQALRLGIESYHEVAEGSKPRGTAKLPLQQFVVDALNIQIPGGIQGFLEQVRGADIHMRREDADPHFSFNLLFYGPSGTGKSALARYIAHILDRELMVKRASDLLSPYVGETEHHIREAFDQAKRQNAVLVLDEMDALCWDRARAVRSFESSFTSELLQALDDFGGAFFIGTTNRFEDLDMAILRRCTLKVEFTWLKSEQVLTLYDHLLAPLVPQALSEFEKQALGEIQGLTPGDMKVVRDRLVLASSSSLTHATVIASLREEVRIRGIRAGSNHPLGF